MVVGSLHPYILRMVRHHPVCVCGAAVTFRSCTSSVLLYVRMSVWVLTLSLLLSVCNTVMWFILIDFFYLGREWSPAGRV
jgi:hypothetical protein